MSGEKIVKMRILLSTVKLKMNSHWQKYSKYMNWQKYFREILILVLTGCIDPEAVPKVSVQTIGPEVLWWLDMDHEGHCSLPLAWCYIHLEWMCHARWWSENLTEQRSEISLWNQLCRLTKPSSKYIYANKPSSLCEGNWSLTYCYQVASL